MEETSAKSFFISFCPKGQYCGSNGVLFNVQNARWKTNVLTFAALYSTVVLLPKALYKSENVRNLLTFSPLRSREWTSRKTTKWVARIRKGLRKTNSRLFIIERKTFLEKKRDLVPDGEERNRGVQANFAGGLSVFISFTEKKKTGFLIAITWRITLRRFFPVTCYPPKCATRYFDPYGNNNLHG